MLASADLGNTVGDGGRRPDRFAEIVFGQQFVLFSLKQNERVAVFVRDGEAVTGGDGGTGEAGGGTEALLDNPFARRELGDGEDSAVVTKMAETARDGGVCMWFPDPSGVRTMADRSFARSSLASGRIA